MMFKLFFLIFTLLMSSISFAQTINESPVGYEAPEHMSAGENVWLQFAANQPKVKNFIFKLPNGLQLSYAEILTLGGDYYGVPEAPISLGKNLAERMQRFRNAYDTLARDAKSYAEANCLLTDIKLEIAEVKEGISKGENPVDIYKRIGTDHLVNWNCITGGFCPSDAPGLPKDVIHKIFVLKPGRILKLDETDFDHFAEMAYVSYNAGHQVALQEAVLASQNNDSQKLMSAYAMNAFACHFLSDAFSSGHMRTPHYQLATTVLPNTVGSVLANYMHNEDDEIGLTVTNQNGDHWKAYGDTFYLDERNQTNRMLQENALQASADEIYAAYANGKMPTIDLVLPLLPDLKILNRNDDHENTAPLFYWDALSKQVLRRQSISDLYQYEFTPTWLGWETLLELINAKGLPTLDHAKLLALKNKG